MQSTATAIRRSLRLGNQRSSITSNINPRCGPCLLCQQRHLTIGQRNSRSGMITARNAAIIPARRASDLHSSKSPAPFTDRAPDISNHYTIFPKTLPLGPPPGGSFDIPVPTLRREFLSLQGLVHPDKYPSGAAKQRAEALSARINDAYRTLSDPLSRAQYLLAFQHGIDVTSEDGAKKHPQDPETLMQVLESQEAIEEAEDEATIRELKDTNEQRVKETIQSLGEALDRKDIDGAVRECVRLRFWYSLRDVLREWEPGMQSVRLIH